MQAGQNFHKDRVNYTKCLFAYICVLENSITRYFVSPADALQINSCSAAV